MKQPKEEDMSLAIKPLQSEIVIDKHTASIFMDTSFEYMLRNSGTITVVFTGIATEFGIESSARDAFNRGLYSVVVSNSVSSVDEYGHNSGNENLRVSVLFFIIVMDSGSLKRSCARALTIAWLHIIRPTHLCLVYGREIVGPGSMTAHYCTKKENEMKK